MPLILLGILVALPVLDIYATFRVAESLNVPGWALFVPGFVFGILLMKRETQTLKSRFVAALASVGVHGVVFDSECSIAITEAFLANPKAKVDTSCLGEVRKKSLDIDARYTQYFMGVQNAWE